MTAINLFLKPNAAHIVTDGAFYAHDGAITQIVSKVVVAERLSMALVCSGKANPARLAQVYLHALGTPTQAVAMSNLPIAIREMRADHLRIQPEHEASGDNDFQVFVALFSHENLAPETWYCTTTDSYDGGLEPFVLRRVAQINTPPCSLPFDDPERDAVAILEEQRRIPWPDGQYCVGGFGELVTVTRDGIDKCRIVEWPDRVGEKITL